MTYLFLAEGFEDIEALATGDILRRASIPVAMVSVTGQRVVKSAHGVAVTADALFESVEPELASAQMLILPGGLPGSTNLAAHEGLCRAITAHAKAGGMLAAICAAPLVFGRLGLLEGRTATCYPGVEGELKGAATTGALVHGDGIIITGKGPAAAFAFAYALVDAIKGEGAHQPLAEGMLYTQL